MTLELSNRFPLSFRAVLKHDWFNEQGKCHNFGKKLMLV